MEIVFHIGAHCTDEGQIQACLVKNRATLIDQGILIPNPGHFRSILRETITALGGAPASQEIQELMISSIAKNHQPDRIVFSNEAFMCNLERTVMDDALYSMAGERTRQFHNLFPDHQVEFCLAIRNPATFLPACYTKGQAGEFEAYLAQVQPQALRWSNTIAEIKSSNPEAQIKIWSNEDTPFIWPELMNEIAGQSSQTDLIGLDDYLASIMTTEGMERMNAYLGSHPPVNEAQRRRILSAFLDKFENEDEMDVSAPEWSEELVDELTDRYEEDLYAIERMPGVQFISP